MNRLALASQALDLSRAILAPVPVQVRIASIVQGFLREADSREDIMLSIGLEALVLMERANTQGDLGGTTIEALRPFIKRNALSQLKLVARSIGGKIFNLSMAKSRSITLDTLEQAWADYAALLPKHPLAHDKDVGEAISFLAKGYTFRIRAVLDSAKNHKRLREENPGYGDDFVSEPGPSPNQAAVWQEIERKFKTNPKLLGPKGEPWAWIYVEGTAGGMTEATIIEQCNEASRRGGGEGAMTRSSFLKWIKNPLRRNVMRSLTKQFLDDATVKRLKVVAARGALKTSLLMPFERELLELLV